MVVFVLVGVTEWRKLKNLPDSGIPQITVSHSRCNKDSNALILSLIGKCRDTGP